MTDKAVKILVIDDEKHVCISCVRILEEENHEVEYVLSGTEGIKKAVAGDYEIVLLDLKMPDISGVEVLEQIKAEKPDLTVIIITGFATIQTSIECIKKGAFDYIPKPFTPEELAIAVEKALEHRALKSENARLKSELNKASGGNMEIIGRSELIEEVRKQILKIAPTDFNIMIYGESGTGKELVARAIHNNSSRKDKPFVAVDISSLTPTLVESELFGHIKGAFTGATSGRPGFFRLAHGGTLFIDEISNIDFALQGKLLRALESRRIRPVGGDADIEVDIRLITATNKDLGKLVEAEEFREDLYYRINVIPITLPPLRERSDDIPTLAAYFLNEASRNLQGRAKGITTEAMAKLLAYRWPGNVRELRNIVERLVATTEAEIIGAEHLPPEITGNVELMPALKMDVPRNAEELKEAKKRLKEMVYSQVEKQFILRVLEEAGWNVTRAAEATGIQRPNLHALIRKYGISVRERDGEE